MATEKVQMLSDAELNRATGGFFRGDYQDYCAFDAKKCGYHCPKCGEQNMSYLPREMGKESPSDDFCCLSCFADFCRSEAVIDKA